VLYPTSLAPVRRSCSILPCPEVWLMSCSLLSTSGGNNRVWILTAMPSTSTTHAEEYLHRHAAVQIDCRLSAERAVASPASHGMPFASVITHNREPTPERRGCRLSGKTREGISEGQKAG
jgi:hypothetical protein